MSHLKNRLKTSKKELSTPCPSMLYSYAQVPSAVYDSLIETAQVDFKEQLKNIAESLLNLKIINY